MIQTTIQILTDWLTESRSNDWSTESQLVLYLSVLTNAKSTLSVKQPYGPHTHDAIDNDI